MAEPPHKRPKRTDSSDMWDRGASELKPRTHHTDRPGPEDTSRRRERRRSRSRSRERGDAGRDRPRGDRNYDSRDGRSKPVRPRERSASRERYNARRGDDRARSRSPRRDESKYKGHRARSPPRGPRTDRSRERRRGDGDRSKANVPETNGTAMGASSKHAADKKDPDEMEGIEEDEDAVMKRMMGFGKFNTTKNSKVPGNEMNYAVRKEKKTMYRQYMNRPGGFNRPLSPG
ncbi:DUF1777-domain-containing protein [Eremomyces bilateralis CBS 781.70]|uniref:DUF1777-domain-containing protein n=1 Tax=Eremomyces bilateralis CBS 781.70 TaxID=1392243 RepID=A0A6G1G965_9PEZI|nr:DUF1777-domain-containing protein [Eremomyces bilateralis CBS 781.70]KAF1814628.1 DUF1777-domain-containing protein [Eremomyces bilateralis CBS 781.70]